MASVAKRRGRTRTRGVPAELRAAVEELERVASSAADEIIQAIPFDLSDKNKALLRQLESERVRARLVYMPDQLMRDVKASLARGTLRFVDAQVAVAVEILLSAPLRPQNLLRQKIDRIVDAIAEGTDTPSLREALLRLEAEKTSLEQSLATAKRRVVPIKPNVDLDALFHQKIERLEQTVRSDTRLGLVNRQPRAAADVVVEMPLGQPRKEVTGEMGETIRSGQLA